MEETLYFGGKILTFAEPLYGEALLERDGIIVAVGDFGTVAAQAGLGAKKVDLAGKAMLPAFLDAHGHLSAYASTLAFADLRGLTTVDEIRRALLDFQKQAKPGQKEWVIGFGYDQNLLPGKKHPDKTFLDALGLENPVMLTHQSGHMGVVDSKGLALLGITEDTPDPAGGLIGRTNGVPNGYLEETAFFAASRVMPPTTPEKTNALIARAEEIYRSYGVTLAQEGLVTEADWKTLEAAPLTMPVYAYMDMQKMPYLPTPTNPMLHAAGYKILLDGSPQGRTAWLRRPYEGEAEYRGYPSHTDEVVEGFCAKALSEGAQLLAHCNGDAAAEQFVRCYGAAREKQPSAKDIRPVMIHAQMLPVELLPRMKALGILPSFFVAHVHRWGDTHLKNLGARARQISPAGSALKQGVPFTFHMDSPVLPPDMLYAVWCAVNRRTAEGVLLGEEERISPYDALCAVTKNAAYQYFLEGERGTLAPGKAADFVLLSRDPLAALPEELREIRVVKTIPARRAQ